MTVQNILIKSIRMDGGTQSRAAINDEVVAEYAETITGGQDLPPVTIYYDGDAYWLADGFHRTHAYIKAGAEMLEADIRQGSRRDAILHSVGANSSHGLRRSAADKRRAVETLIRDDEWSKWSDREIARQCGVSPSSVAKYKGELGLTVQMDSEKPQERTYTDKHGNKGTMNTENIGGKKPTDNAGPNNPEIPKEGTPEPQKTEDISPVDGWAKTDDQARPLSPYADLTREALEDDLIAVVEENSELKEKLERRDEEIEQLKAHIKDLSSEGQGAVISRLERQRITLKGQMRDYQAATKREEYKRKKAEERVAELEAVGIAI